MRVLAKLRRRMRVLARLRRRTPVPVRISHERQHGLPFENFRGGQAGRHLERSASPGARGSVFSGSEVCRRIHEPHAGYQRSAVAVRRSLHRTQDRKLPVRGTDIGGVFRPQRPGRPNGFLLQASYGELFNDHWRFAAGLQFDVFAPGLPTVLPFSYLGGSGSPGNCIRGQIRVERFVNVGSESQLTLQGAVSQPLNTFVTPDIILDEDNGWPNVEGRIVFGGGKPAPIGIGLLTQRPVEVGVSGLVGQLRRTAPPTEPPRRVVSDVWGAAVDFRVNLAGSFGFKGEAYTGQALGNYNGAILQSLDAVTWEAISATGGFVEGFVYLKPSLHSHAGYGIDDPDNDDMTAIPNTLFGRTYNSTFYSNLLWDLDRTFRIAFEATYRKTEYKEPTNLPNEGFGFHTQFQWTF